jgi:hypothetical protein
MTATHEYLADIAKRNRLRSEVSLPLLDVSTEMARLERVLAEAEFDRFFQREHHRFAHLMVGRQGFMAQMGMWSLIRKRLRDEWQNSRSAIG